MKIRSVLSWIVFPVPRIVLLGFKFLFFRYIYDHIGNRTSRVG